MTCSDFRPRLPAYLTDELAPAARMEFRAHLTSCGECRSAAVETEPTLLFSASAPEDDRADEVRMVLANVRAAIAVRETEKRIEKPATSRRAHRRVVVGLASAAVLAGLALLTPRAQAPLLPAAPDTSSAALMPPASVITPVRLSKSLEPVSPSSATVYEWNTNRGKSDGMKIVWIVDRSLDL